MSQMTQTDGGRTDTKRHTSEFTAGDLIEGDRIDPKLVAPHHMDLDDDPGAHYQQMDDHPGFQLETIVADSDRYDDVQYAILYDPETDLFVRVGGHTSSGAWNQKERDWKVRDIGATVTVDDLLDIEYGPDDPEDYDDVDYAAEWLDILFGNAAHGDDITHEIHKFDGKKIALRDYDNRRVEATITLEG